MTPYGSIRECMSYMALYGFIWDFMSCMAPYGSFGVCMANMALYGYV
jgi:hypothetical protein